MSDNQNSSSSSSESKGKVCNCPHHKMFPLFIVLIGLTFLLGALNVFTPMAVNIIWPILLILAGLQRMFGRKCNCCRRPM